MFADACLLLPRWSLSSCVRAYIGRDTVGHALSARQRLNYFPASPLCAITWFVQGQAHPVAFQEGERGGTDDPPPLAQPLPRVTFSGPFSQPTVSYNPGPVRAFMVLLLPDAWRALTGIDAAAHFNRFADAHEVLPRAWHGVLADVLHAVDDRERAQAFDAFLAPQWQATRPVDGAAGRLVQDWAQGLAVRAATSGLGRSLRQSERRIKEWTGQSLRQLRVFGRGERSLLASAELLRAGVDIDWAEVAAATGYADQSHLCRESRRLTGFTPNELRRRVLEDESAWVYRIWGG